ncbi:HAD-IC family P-type ATPase [Wukongibacter baidiensis]|uniref:HAD-IC family P-type ATPase n=1 Tax=Wukongibacter baidiensis TaxID=1723361 RepID=UPI003D7F9390
MEVLSYVPGRVRFKEIKIYKNKKLSDVLRLYLNEWIGVKKIKVNPVLGTISLKYDANRVTVNDLKEKIEKTLSYDEEYLYFFAEHYKEYLIEEKNLQVAKRKMILFGSIYILYKIKQHFFGKYAIANSLPVLRIAALVTIIKGYPKIKRAYNRIGSYFPTNPDKLLLMIAISLSLIREGSKGTMLLFLKAFTDAMNSYSSLQIKRILLMNTSNPSNLIWFNHENKEYLMPLRSIEPGDIVTFYENENILVDGSVVEGNATINQLYYSGQPEIKRIRKRSRVYEGMVITSGSIKVRVINVPNRSFKPDVLLEKLKIKKRVKKYQEKSIYTASILSFISYLITGSTLAPLSVLLLMTPSASNVALNSGLANYLKLLLRNKIVLRNVNTVEKLIHANSIVFDKTGTLTKGRLKIANIELYDKKYTEDEILRICSLCEGNVCHPVARSLKVHDFYSEPLASEPIYIPSKGIIANYQGHKVVIGNQKLMKDRKISLKNTDNTVSIDQGFYLPVYVAIDRNICAKISLIEELEETAVKSVSLIKELGITDISIVSGDLKSNTGHIARSLNLEDYHGGLSPSAKERYVEDKKTFGSVLMVGDGINDTAALKSADVSISFVNNSCQQAVLKSDCILEEKNMLLIPRLMSLTEKSYYRIQRNIDFSQNFNYVMGSIAMFGYIGPFKAKGLNTANSILAMINSMRILNIKANDKLLMRGENN